MQVQIIHVHIYMATTITFVITIVMKGKSPPSIMCTRTTNDIYYELKCDNDTIIMKMLNTRKCTSPNKPYFTPSPSFMSKREYRETSTTKTELRLHKPLRHLCQVFSRHLCLWTYDIFAYFPRVRLHRLHQVQSGYLRARATLPPSEAPQGRWPSMGISLRSWRRATRCHIIWASNNKTATRRLSMGLSLQPRRR